MGGDSAWPVDGRQGFATMRSCFSLLAKMAADVHSERGKHACKINNERVLSYGVILTLLLAPRTPRMAPQPWPDVRA